MQAIVVRDIMSSPPICITPDTPARDAMLLMERHCFRRLPVATAGHLVGIVTERDFHEASLLLEATTNPFDPQRSEGLEFLVEEVMSTEVVTTEADTPILDVANIMLSHRIGALPVVDSDKHIVGIVTESDIFKLLIRILSENKSSGNP